MKVPSTLSAQILSFLFKDKAGLIRHLKEIQDSPVSFFGCKREGKTKEGGDTG